MRGLLLALVVAVVVAAGAGSIEATFEGRTATTPNGAWTATSAT